MVDGDCVVPGHAIPVLTCWMIDGDCVVPGHALPVFVSPQVSVLTTWQHKNSSLHWSSYELSQLKKSSKFLIYKALFQIWEDLNLPSLGIWEDMNLPSMGIRKDMNLPGMGIWEDMNLPGMGIWEDMNLPGMGVWEDMNLTRHGSLRRYEPNQAWESEKIWT